MNNVVDKSASDPYSLAVVGLTKEIVLSATTFNVVGISCGSGVRKITRNAAESTALETFRSIWPAVRPR
jgi:hypothetical protein